LVHDAESVHQELAGLGALSRAPVREVAQAYLEAPVHHPQQACEVPLEIPSRAVVELPGRYDHDAPIPLAQSLLVARAHRGFELREERADVHRQLGSGQEPRELRLEENGEVLPWLDLPAARAARER